MTEVPTPKATFNSDMDPVAVKELTRDLSPPERIRFWGTFVPTAEVTRPGIITSEAVDDVAAVFAGSKPATLLDTEERYLKPAVPALIDAEGDRYKELHEAQVVDHRNGNRLNFLGQRENVETLAALYQDLIRSGRDFPTPEFDRAVGEAFGYPPEAIAAHIEKTSTTENALKAKGRVRRALGRLAAKRRG